MTRLRLPTAGSFVALGLSALILAAAPTAASAQSLGK